VHLGPFGWIAKTRCKTGLQVQKFVLPSRVGILRNERTQSSELDSKLLFLCVLFYLGAFGTVWLPYSVQNGQNWCKSSCHEVGSEFFRNKRNRSIADRKRSSRSGWSCINKVGNHRELVQQLHWHFGFARRSQIMRVYFHLVKIIPTHRKIGHSCSINFYHFSPLCVDFCAVTK